MCLIAYVPAGKSLKREVFDNANRVNPDGIGVMSARGIEKFYGNKQLKRARAYVAELVKDGLAHGVHWRYATHGSKGLVLCHPFKLPNVEAHLMHNGVIYATAHEANEDASDTLLYVNKLIDAPASHEDLTYWNRVCTEIGKSNKGLVMYPDGKFVILNKEEGATVEDIWYSNQYSLPIAMRQNAGYFVPTRLRPTSWQGYSGGSVMGLPRFPGNTGSTTGGYYDTGTRASDYGGPFGHMIYWSEPMKAYGFWESGRFNRLKVERDAIITPFPVELKADPKRVPLAEREKCPRCFRYKTNPPAGFLPCWCTDESLQDHYAKHPEDAPEATEKPAMPSGPSLELDLRPDPITVPAPSGERCEHGQDNWENCRECIADLETDSASEVQRWLAKRHGHHWSLKDKPAEPSDRADELAAKVVYLPAPQSSEK